MQRMRRLMQRGVMKSRSLDIAMTALAVVILVQGTCAVGRLLLLASKVDYPWSLAIGVAGGIAWIAGLVIVGGVIVDIWRGE